MRLCFKGLLLAGFLFLGNMAFAQGSLTEEIRCISGDCLTNGFEKYDANGDLVSVAICNGMDCDQLGWDIFMVTGNTTAVQCIDNSCYSNGFQEFDPVTNMLIRIRTCFDGDCLANGWQDHFFVPAESIERIECDPNQSCTAGFIINEVEEAMNNNPKKERRLKRKIRFAQRVIVILSRIQARVHHPRIKRKLQRKINRWERHIARLEQKLEALNGEVVVSSKAAICLSTNGCFTDGYQIFE